MKIKLFSVFFIILFILGSSYAVNINACGVTISEDSVLTQDIVSVGGNCITIDTENVTLDCQNFRITNPGAGYDGIKINSGANNLTIQNCKIYNTTNAIYSSSTNSKFLNNYIYNTTNYGILLSGGSDCLVDGNTLSYIGSDAIGLYFSPENNTISNNLIFKSSTGIMLSNAAVDNIVINNTILNSSYGINFASAETTIVTNNNIHYSSNYALVFWAWGYNNNITNNDLRNNAVNVYFEDSGNVVFPIDNTFTDNLLDNRSMINTSNGNNWAGFTNTFIGNYYNDYSWSGPYCFDIPTNSSCDSNPFAESAYGSGNPISSQSSSVMPFGNLIASFIAIIGFLFLN